MRIVFCSYCPRPIRGHGVTRVLRRVVFHFCAGCWSRRSVCEAFMRRVADLPDSGVKGVAEVARATEPATLAGLPETPGLFSDFVLDPILPCFLGREFL
jgi:hypothetical protein